MSTPNVDEIEINKFNRSNEDWWSPEGSFRTLHHLNPTRLDFIVNHVDLAGKRVLDVGCGGGILTESMSRLGAKVTGIDLASDALAVARHHAQAENLDCDYQQDYVEDWAEQHTHQYDIVTCLEMLEHVPDPSRIVHACAQAVKPGGWVFFSTINRTFQAYLFAVIAAEYLLHLLPKKTHDYAKFIKPAELASWCRDNQLNLQTLRGLAYHPWNKTASLSDSLEVNYLLACQAEIFVTNS